MQIRRPMKASMKAIATWITIESNTRVVPEIKERRPKVSSLDAEIIDICKPPIVESSSSNLDPPVTISHRLRRPRHRPQRPSHSYIERLHRPMLLAISTSAQRATTLLQQPCWLPLQPQHPQRIDRYHCGGCLPVGLQPSASSPISQSEPLPFWLWGMSEYHGCYGNIG